jgi:hypothetical protein
MQLTLTEAQTKLRSGELSPRDLVQGVLDAAEQRDAEIGGYLSIQREAALGAADKADTSLPLGGIPIAIKDAIIVEGEPCASASKILADKYIARLREIKRSRNLHTPKILLAADIHTKCQAWQIVAYLKRIKELTGVTPVVYLENSGSIRRTLNAATPAQKRFLRQHPYWLALYSTSNTGLETPQKLADASGVWNTWAMWQYGGVWWENGRSKPHYYRGGSWNTPKYFGNLSQPTERNGFNGSRAAFYQFWNKHAWAW